jgi:hypothetical protein
MTSSVCNPNLEKKKKSSGIIRDFNPFNSTKNGSFDIGKSDYIGNAGGICHSTSTDGGGFTVCPVGSLSLYKIDL